MKSISDVVSGSGLAHFAEVALVIFFVVFVVVALRAMLTNRATLDRAAHLPFEDDAPRANEPNSHGPPAGRAS